MNIAKVIGNENEIKIEVNGQTFEGDLVDMGDDGSEQEMWQIEGRTCYIDPIYCALDLQDLAEQFLALVGIKFDKVEAVFE